MHSLKQLLLLSSLAVILVTESAAVDEMKQLDLDPELPIWFDVFTIQFDILVEQYGSDWKSEGVLYYHWPNKTFRSDFIDWCLPHFDSGDTGYNNYTCSFLATGGNMYFVNHTSPRKNWTMYDCCLFQEDLPATPPDWMKNSQYNGTDTIDGFNVDVWWLPGTNDPINECFAYWNIRDAIQTPFRFFGLASVGPTILEYNDFKPGTIPNDIELFEPGPGCRNKCESPSLKKMMFLHKEKKREVKAPWPDWPSCE